MKTGRYQIDIIQECRILVDGGITFAGIPRTHWEKIAEPDKKNRIPLGVNQLLIQGSDSNILIDCGIGCKHRLLRFEHPNGSSLTNIRDSLKQFQLTPEDITQVVFTHLHIDHCGGATEDNGEDITAVFKNAKFIIQKEEWQVANKPDEYSRCGYSSRDFLPLIETGNIEFISGDCEIADNIFIEVSGGHTLAHQIIRIEDSQNRVFFPADICPTPFHLELGRREAFDLYPTETLHARKILLGQALCKDTLIAFSHSNSPVFHRIEYDNDIYSAVEINDEYKA